MTHEVEPKEGGYLLVQGRHNRSLHKIDKITKLHIVSQGIKYNLRNGWEIGKDRWSFSTATAISDEKAAQIREEFRINRETHEMRDRITEAVKTAEHATLTQIVAILEARNQ